MLLHIDPFSQERASGKPRAVQLLCDILGGFEGERIDPLDL
jgi:hypothetical protein